MAIYGWLIGACWLAFVVVWAVGALGTKVATRPGLGARGTAVRIAVLLVLVAVGQIATGGGPGGTRSTLATALPPVGLLLAVAGLSLAVWARLHLGRNWGMPMSAPENAKLVGTGPYARIRHPIYSGILLMAFGSALVLGAWWGFLSILTLAYFVVSAQAEEAVMEERFPKAYAEYRKRTKMFIPFIL